MKNILLFILLPIFVFPRSWYVSNTSSGDSSANKWNNKKWIVSFDWSAVLAGDTVFIDGGVDSCVYNYWLWPRYINGTSLAKIVITKGKEDGHNGKVLFSIPENMDSSALYLYYVTHLEISHLHFRTYNDKSYGAKLTEANYCDIIYCDIEHPATTAIVVESSNHCRILHNYTHTGDVFSPYNDEPNKAVTDGIFLTTRDYSGGYSIEIAYNKIHLQNNTGIGHKDLIQTTRFWGGNGGVNKIHHNFFLHNPDDTTQYCSGLYLHDVGGYWEIYNNIIALGGGGPNPGSQVTIEEYDRFLDTSDTFVKVLNNTIVSLNGRSTYPAIFSGVDSLEFKNNLIYSPNSHYAMVLSGNTEHGYLDIDYNQYMTLDTSYFGYLDYEPDEYPSWYNWKKIVGGEFHSEVDGFELKDTSSTNAAGYMLKQGSSGINEGTVLTLFSNDFANSPRPMGSAWDVGAFENLDGGSGLEKLIINGAYSNNWLQNYSPDKSIDGLGSSNPNSRWACASNLPDTILFDLGSIKSVSRFLISFYGWEIGREYLYSVHASSDKVTWNAVFENVWSSSTEWQSNAFNSTNARYFKLIISGSNQNDFAGVWEAEFWGINQTTDILSGESHPHEFSLSQNYPNPFNPNTKIKISIPPVNGNSDDTRRVQLTVYDILGGEVCKLIDQYKPTGEYEVEFSATKDGSKLSSGVYFYQLKSLEFAETKKMVLLQ